MSDPRPRCPFCNSKQTRFTPSKSNILKSRFSCKSCGGSFTIDTDFVETKGGCLGSILKILAFIVIVVIGISIFIAMDRTDSKSSQSSINEDKKPELDQTHLKEVENAVEAENFEHAAHDYIPTDEDYKKLEQSQKVQKSDNLTIVETTRKAEQ
ncbi:hypothetical protein [Acinetobacter baumannii]|uniref:hypothetical protein n=1 Tax=Acinetobacter baumannii TaxID=470 RepID=UPI00249B92BF|nr:hypothetical protein [Acinetobacter baumannii]MDI2700628.1 hypothetical protein [Acinetobacter baumannii]MDI7714742.1 hypothetical protein [Acinetobacter baumannii]